MINHPWKCKKGKNRRSPLVHSRQLAEHNNFTRAVSRRYRDRGQEIGKYCPLLEPIRLQNSQDTARSRSITITECGVRSAECGVRSAECGVRSAECGVRSAECGVRSAECGVRSAECGLWSLNKKSEKKNRKINFKK